MTREVRPGATENGAELVRVIAAFTRDNGMPPTMRELADATGVSTTSVIVRLRRLEKLGLVRRKKRIPRSIQVVQAA